jgi:hypothetical protein
MSAPRSSEAKEQSPPHLRNDVWQRLEQRLVIASTSRQFDVTDGVIELIWIELV